MPLRNARRLAALGTGVLLVASLAASVRSGGANDHSARATATVLADAPAHCCFTNPRYVGTCDVEPNADESCASILGYLNNPQSQGKTYCGSTSVRGDWKAASCETKTGGD